MEIQKQEYINIGSGRASSWNELASAIFKAMGKEINIEYVDMPDSLKNQYQYYSKANPDKIMKAGYVNDVTSIEDSVRDYVVNYLAKDKYLAP